MLGRITSTTSTLLPSYDARNPPSYSPANSSSAAPPPITWPAEYRVGSHGVRLVSTDEVKRHLTLLASFDKLRRAVEEMEAPKWCAQVETKQRWALFVRVAVNRFEKYLDSLYRRNAQEIDPPPLDVALVLHTYLLNPGRYHEDSIRGDLALGKTKDLMLTRIVNTIDAVTLIQTVTDVAMQEWEERTKTRWDPLANFLETKGIVLTLPETTVNPGGEALVPWLDGGRGYAEEGFEVKKGSQIWTHELLGLHSLAFDLNNCRLSSLSTLAGTVVSSSDAPDLPSQSRRAKYVRQKLYDQMPVKICSSPQDMFRILGSRQGAEVLLRAALGPKNEGGVRNILACYSRGERFSLDLGMAVLRQGVFVDKMKTLGWLNTDRFKGDDTLLRRSIARYHAFLDLIFSSSSMFCVPTLDIDLAWHTHQLKRLYREDTIALGRFVQHEDKVEETALGNAFDATAQAWQTRFGIPYSTCGCPLPSQRPLTRLSSALGRAPSHLKTVYPAGTLSHTVDDNGGTHGSEHNSILLPFHPQAVKARKAREKELEVRRRKEAAEKAKRARRGAPTGDFDDEGEKRRKQHGIAFLAPVPLIAFGAGVGAGVGFGTAGGCVAFEANVSWNGLDQGRSGGSGCGGGSSGACVSASQIGSCGSSVSSCASCGGGSGGDGGIGSGGGGGGCGGGSSGGGGDGGGGGGGGCGGGS